LTAGRWFLALSVLTAPWSPPALAQPTFAELARAGQLPYRGELVINGRTIVRVSHGGPGLQRQEVLAPPDLAGELVVDNGQTRWHYSPRTMRVDLAPSSYGLRRPEHNQHLLERNFHLVVIRSEPVAGRPATEIELRPRYAGRNSQRLWIDAATGLPLKVQRLSPRGVVLETSEFRHLEPHATIGRSEFEFALPPRARVTSSVQVLAMGRSLADLHMPVPFPIRMPGYLPAGFDVMDVQIFERGGVRSVHWRLSDGLDMLSLFQTAREHEAPRPAGAQVVTLPHVATGFMVDHGPERMLCWQTGAGSFSLVGDLGPDELERIADSTSP
jgi:outer membrane lipoprotein-sorting protein